MGVIANLASSHRTCLPCNPISLATERIYHRLQPATFPTCSSPRLLPLRNPDRASAKPSSAHTQLRAHTQIATTHPYQRSKMSSAQANIQNYLGQLDKELSKYPTINNLEKQSGIPKAYAVIGAGALYFFLVVFNLGGQLLTNFAGFVIPGYYSLAALFTHNTEDDTQWLTYWVVFAFFTVAESFINIVYWFPFYFVFKFIFLLWLSLPMFRGADLIFRSFLAPTLGRYFNQGGATASTLRSKAEGFNKAE